MANELTTLPEDFQPVIDLVLNSVHSDHSRRAYKRALVDFLHWWEGQGRPPLSKATVNQYKVKQLDKLGLAPASINVRLSAIRKLASEAADNGLLDQTIANGINRVKGVKQQGNRAGRWLTKDQAEAVLSAPDTSRIGGLRDRAILAVMIGAGLRRSEVVSLTFEHIQQREGRWVIVDLVGKRQRIRTVPIPSWAKAAIDEWSEAAGLRAGRVFRGIYRYGLHLDPESIEITPQAIARVCAHYAYKTGIPFSAHDLRRTFAKLARKGGAELTQIQLTLGHSSSAVTQNYIGEALNLADAPCDRLGLDLSGD